MKFIFTFCLFEHSRWRKLSGSKHPFAVSHFLFYFLLAVFVCRPNCWEPKKTCSIYFGVIKYRSRIKNSEFVATIRCLLGSRRTLPHTMSCILCICCTMYMCIFLAYAISMLTFPRIRHMCGCVIFSHRRTHFQQNLPPRTHVAQPNITKHALIL